MKRILLFTTQLAAWAAMACCLFMILGTLLAILEGYTSIDAPLVDKAPDYGAHYYQFGSVTGTSLIFPLSLKMIAVWISLGFYAFYFWKLKDFFEAFQDRSSFSRKAVKDMKTFFLLNMIPVVFVLLLYVFGLLFRDWYYKIDEDWMYVVVHGAIAILTFFYYDMVKKGHEIKEENDLTI